MPRHSAGAAPNISAAPDDIQEQENTPQDLQSFLNQHCPDSSYVCKVYHLKPNIKGGNKPERQLIDEYLDTFPSIRDLGVENGSGTYEYFFYISKKGGGQELKSMRINLAPRWDIIRDQNLASQGINPATRPDGLQTSLSVMKDMIQVITPLLQAQSASAAKSDPAGLLNSMVEMQGRILNQNFTSQIDMQNKMINKIEETRKNYVSGDNDNNDSMLMSEIIGTLKSFVPLLIAAPQKTAQALTSQAIQKRPDIQSLVDNAGRRAALENKIKAEFDPATAKKVISVLSGISGGNGKQPVQTGQQAGNKAQAAQERPRARK